MYYFGIKLSKLFPDPTLTLPPLFQIFGSATGDMASFSLKTHIFPTTLHSTPNLEMFLY